MNKLSAKCRNDSLAYFKNNVCGFNTISILLSCSYVIFCNVSLYTEVLMLKF